uniref:Uncharacterized protein LOC104237066 n=1 Tax=Nicotiana sylvestris TaxID=4096 RepID=A0A1U7XIH7_NICSY|nr:PREDICTED: uncharacterized protein LOC104237066 [Nicotiana sylvestris]
MTGILETSGVSFTMFQFTGAAFRLWEAYERRSPVGATPLSWHEFSVLFSEKFMSPTRREELRKQFEQLRQNDMFVTQYEMRFLELAHRSFWLVPTERKSIWRFIDGLTYQLRFSMTRESVSGARFDELVDIARRLEMSSSHAPSIQGSSVLGPSSSYSGTRGPMQSPPSPLGSCFECEELGHMWRQCPYYPGGPVQ